MKNYYVVFFYSILLIALGIKGYMKGSAASLCAGAGIGFLLFLSSIGLFFQKKIALYSALLLTECLNIVFLIRYLKTFAFTPLALGILSLAIFIFLLFTLLSKQRSLRNHTDLSK